MKFLLIAFLLCFISINLFAQDSTKNNNNGDSISFISDNSELSKKTKNKRLSVVILSKSAFYIAGNSYLQFVWYKDHKPVPFHFYNDNKGWLQLDKVGHFYAAYHESKVGYNSLKWADVSDKKAFWYGGFLGLILQTPIEIFDGLYEGYGFSVGDMIANASGSGLFMTQQHFFKEQIILPKFSYSPSPYAKYRPWVLGESHTNRFFQDYNGHTYWFSTNLKRIFKNKNIPSWLNIAFGYSGNGMLAEFENPEFSRGIEMPKLERHRQFLLSLDVDMTKIKTKSKFLKGLLGTINLLKIPAPALEYNKEKGFVVHGIYF
ncbi:DUF2279 domain-containing protein [Bernardetia sp. ABR2-2B]|uniref:DUF2279 domain-containing protein n=1 Tax=Bernardetia sp. ABR2-2B TaxID=3127472 RepID=UPI0030CD3F42